MTNILQLLLFMAPRKVAQSYAYVVNIQIMRQNEINGLMEGRGGEGQREGAGYGG